MKKIIKLFSIITISLFVSLMVLALSSCKRTKTTEFTDKGEVGSYYSYGDVDKSLVLENGKITFNNGSSSVTGTYTFDGVQLVFTIDGANINTNYNEVTIAFTYAGNDYLLYKAIDYTVSFEVNGGSAVSSQTVKNGAKAVKPADPTKAEYVFAGWYKDNIFTQEFDFSTEVITADVKLYAKFESDNELNVFFETGIDGVTVNKVRTVDQVVVGLPTLEVDGKTFVGWFESDYDTIERISREFVTGTEIEEDTTLYAVFESEAPVVSAFDDKIVIKGSDSNEYTIEVTNSDDDKVGIVYANITSEHEVDFSFTALPPANYIVSVMANGKTGYAFVNNVNGDWEPVKYNVTLDYQYYNPTDPTTDEVTLGAKYELAVPEAENSLKAFIGWFSAPNAQGLRYTDETGASLSVWYDQKDVTLYAGWKDVFAFDLINDGTEYQVKKGDGINYVKEITIPYEYNGKPVTTIAASAFISCQKLTKIYIPNTITNVEIGATGPNGTGSAFQTCSKLEGLYMYEVPGFDPNEALYSTIDGVLLYNNPDTGVELKWFPYNALTGTYRIPEQVEVLPIYAFRGSSKITEIIIPAGVKLIDYAAFTGCSGLTKIIFEEPKAGVEAPVLEIGEKAFSCSSLVEITLPSRLTSFSPILFGTNLSLTAVNINKGSDDQPYVSIDGVVYNKEKTEIVFCPRGRVGVFETPVGVQKIGVSAFDGCVYLTKIIISGQVNYIDDYAFNNCTGVEELVFEGVTGDAPLTISTGAFYGLTNALFKELVLPQNLVTLKTTAFGGCSSLETVTVTSTSETLSFENGAFGSASAVPVFYVTDLVIKKDVADFSIAGVFGSTKLTYVEVEEGNANYVSVDGVLYNNNKTQIAYFPAAREGAYVIEPTVTSIGANTFEGRKYITEITIPAGVTAIGNQAFKDCTNLTKVVFASGGTSDLTIGSYAFENCQSLVDINLPERLKTIGDNAFLANYSLRTIVIPEGTTSLGDKAFQDCILLKDLSIPSTLTDIVESTSTVTGDKDSRIRVFDNCTSLTNLTVASTNPNYSAIDGILYKNVTDDGGTIIGKQLVLCPAGKGGKITIPDGVISIANRAFYGNKFIEEVRFAGRLADESVLGLNTFYGNENLKVLELPEGLATIATNSIMECNNLTTINIPGSVSVIEKLSIVNCAKLSTITFTDSDVPLSIRGEYTITFGKIQQTLIDPPFKNTSIASLDIPERTVEIGDVIFAGNTLITEITIPKNVERIGNGAFSDTPNLKTVTFEEGSKLKYLCGTSTTVTADVFRNSGIEEINLPEGLITLGQNAFANCANLRKVTIPSTLQEISTGAFTNCVNLKEVVFAPNSTLKTIGIQAFAFTGIKDLVLPASIEIVGNYSFTSARIETVTFELNADGVSSLKQIGESAFADTRIKEFTFPYTGMNGELLNEIVIGTVNASLTAKRKLIFDKCNYLETVNVSANVKDLNELFAGCPALKNINFINNDEFTTNNPLILGGTGEQIIKVYGKIEGEYTIPNVVTMISPYAFYGQANITKIIIPSSVKEIGGYAFARCSSLETVVFQEGAADVSLSNNVFSGCTSLKNVTLSNNISYLGERMFLGCTSLANITIPTSVKTIGSDCFAACTSLAIETIPSTVTTIESSAFAGSGITKMTLPEGLTSLGNYAFKKCTNLVEISFPSTLTTLDTEICSYCTSLKNITFKEGLKKIGMSFMGCTALEEITLPASLTYLYSTTYTDSSIDNYLAKLPTTTSALTYSSKAFEDCTSLKTVIFAQGGPNLVGIGGQAFDGCTSLKNIVIPSTVKCIGNNAFSDCTSLETIVIPEAVTILGSAKTIGKTFMNCTNLKNVTLPSGLTALYGSVFQNCASLEEISLPASCVKLGSYVFAGCTSLKKAEILGKVTTWGATSEHLFDGCTALSDVNIASTNASLSNSMFLNCVSLKTFTMPTNYTASAATTAIEVFKGCTALEEITLPQAVGYIGNYLFDGCTSLKKVTFAGTQINGLGNYAFHNCVGLTDITIPALKTVTNFGEGVFDGCTNLKNVKLDDTTQTIGKYAFRNCVSLKNINLPTSLKNLNEGCFEGSGLTSIMIPASVTAIGTTQTSGAFKDCKELSEVVFLGNVSTIGAGAFNGCTALETIELPASVSYIGKEAFANSGLTEIAIPTYVVGIGGGAFNGCINLTNVVNAEAFVLNNGLIIDLENNAIVGVVGDVLDVVVPDGMTITESAFSGQNKLNSVTLPLTCTTIVDNMFANANVKKIIIQSDVVVGANAFKGSLVEEIEGTEHITAIGASAFANTTNLKSVALSDKLTAIGANAFDGSGIESITIPGSVKWIGGEGDSSKNGNVFANTLNLNTAVFEEGVEHVNISAFANSNVKSVVFPLSANDLGASLLNNAKELKTVVIKGNTIGSLMFTGCESIETITLEGDILTIENNLFKDLTNLKTIVLPETVYQIGTNAFQNCTSLTSINIPNGIVNIQKETFSGCTSLESIHIPSSVVSIASRAFENCTSLKTVTIEEGLWGLGDIQVNTNSSVSPVGYVFSGCTALETINLPSTLRYIASFCFAGCTSISEIVIPASVIAVGGQVFDGWTDAQKICIEAEEYDIAGLWFLPSSYASDLAYNANSDAEFIFGYKKD